MDEREWVVSVEFRVKTPNLADVVGAINTKLGLSTGTGYYGGVTPCAARIVGVWDAAVEGA